jgi:hypothetical protein
MNRSLIPILSAVALAGCLSPEEPLVGEAQARITQVPADVSCVRITIAGSRTVVRSFDVTPGQSSVLPMAGLPVGAVMFTGEAFAAACGAPTLGTATWLSDPTPAMLSAGNVVNVALALRKNGGANVAVDFEDDDGGAPLDGGVPAADLAPQADMGGPPDLASPSLWVMMPPQLIYSFIGEVRTVNVFWQGISTTPAVQSSIFGPNASSFQIVGGNCAAPMAPNTSCVVQVRFQPLLPGGMHQATLQVGAPGAGSATAQLRNF